MPSPTQRTLAKLRKDGYTCAIVEKYNSFIKCRQDLFGFIDILAIKENETLGVQTTSGSNSSERVEKIKANKYYSTVKKAGWKIIVHGWRKLKKTGWECKEINL